MNTIYVFSIRRILKTKIKKSSIISLVIAFSMVFTAFTPIVSYADEVTSNDTILNGEE